MCKWWVRLLYKIPAYYIRIHIWTQVVVFVVAILFRFRFLILDDTHLIYIYVCVYHYLNRNAHGLFYVTFCWKCDFSKDIETMKATITNVTCQSNVRPQISNCVSFFFFKFKNLVFLHMFCHICFHIFHCVTLVCFLFILSFSLSPVIFFTSHCII